MGNSSARSKSQSETRVSKSLDMPYGDDTRGHIPEDLDTIRRQRDLLNLALEEKIRKQKEIAAALDAEEFKWRGKDRVKLNQRNFIKSQSLRPALGKNQSLR